MVITILTLDRTFPATSPQVFCCCDHWPHIDGKLRHCNCTAKTASRKRNLSSHRLPACMLVHKTRPDTHVYRK